MPAAHAKDSEAIVQGRIYVAPPDRHLIVRRGLVEVSRGPRENHNRPAIDLLFRSAARSYDSRVVGVILSGALYDGAAGMLAIKERGGVAIVQNAEEAMVPSMPPRTMEMVDVDRILSARDIGRELARLAQDEIAVTGDEPMVDEEEQLARVLAEDFEAQAQDGRDNEASVYTCPDCGGVLWQAGAGPGTWFRCHVGNAYAPEVLLGQKSEEVEAALWACVRLLPERATLTRQTAARTASGRNGDLAARIDEQAQRDKVQAQLLVELPGAMPGVVDLLEAGRSVDASSPGQSG